MPKKEKSEKSKKGDKKEKRVKKDKKAPVDDVVPQQPAVPSLPLPQSIAVLLFYYSPLRISQLKFHAKDAPLPYRSCIASRVIAPSVLFAIKIRIW
jgi:hypothetical protein